MEKKNTNLASPTTHNGNRQILTPSELAGIHINDPDHKIDQQKIQQLKVGADVDGRSKIKAERLKKENGLPQQ